jgi:Tfp pilus assembly protein PilF
MNPLGRRGSLSGALFLVGLAVSSCVSPGFHPVSATLSETPVAVEPKRAETYLSVGKRLLAAREPDLAIKAFQRSINNEGVSAQAMTGAGIGYQRMGLLTTARRYFEQATFLAPNSTITHNNLGVVLYQMKEYYLARDEFRTAFAISNGASEMAESNLNRTEAIIAAIELAPETDQAISHDVIRLGGGEFQLVDADLPEVDAMAE